MTKPIYLVACVSVKLPHAAPAADLYQSPWFKKARALAECESSMWRILSAWYGVLDPEHKIAPYNLTLNDMTREDRARWATRIGGMLQAMLPPDVPLVVLAGKRYRACLADLPNPISVPMLGMGIGYQLQWLTHQLAAVAS